MEILGQSPRFLLDGAHNPAGGEALAEALTDVTRARLLIVAGVMCDKDAEGILSPLLPLAAHVFAVSPRVERAMASGDLATVCNACGVASTNAGAVADGLAMARNAAEPDDLILVCGSLFTVGEARAILLSDSFEPCRG